MRYFSTSAGWLCNRFRLGRVATQFCNLRSNCQVSKDGYTCHLDIHIGRGFLCDTLVILAKVSKHSGRGNIYFRVEPEPKWSVERDPLIDTAYSARQNARREIFSRPLGAAVQIEHISGQTTSRVYAQLIKPQRGVTFPRLHSIAV